MYAPLPDFFPVASITTFPSGVRTTRNNSRLGLFSRQEMQVRRGTCLGLFGCLFAAFVMLFPSLPWHLAIHVYYHDASHADHLSLAAHVVALVLRRCDVFPLAPRKSPLLLVWQRQRAS